MTGADPGDPDPPSPAANDAATGATPQTPDPPEPADDAGITQPPQQQQNEAGANGADAGTDAAPVVFAAPHPPLPQVVKSAGPVLAAPKLVAITFAGDTLRTQIEQFTSTLGATPYWTAIATEYGVGPATAGPPVHVATAAPAKIDDTQIQTFLKAGFSSGTLGVPDPSTIYTLFYPSTTVITSEGDKSCQVYDGYHAEVAVSATVKVPYAVIARCTNEDIKGIDQVTFVASHEFIEASTDPFIDTDPAYVAVADADDAWSVLLGGSEVGDMCQDDIDAEYRPDGFAFLVQRVWSNAAAAAGTNPCVPAVAIPYFNAVPVLTDMLTIQDPYFGPLSVRGVKIAAGQSKTVEVDLFSEVDTAEWNLAGLDSFVVTGAGADDLQFAFDKPTGKNGDKINMTITVLTASAAGSPFFIESTLNKHVSVFAGMVGQ